MENENMAILAWWEEIEKEALEKRRRSYSRMLSFVDLALFKAASEGNVQAIRLVYEKFEGLGQQKQAHGKETGQKTIRLIGGFQDYEEGKTNENH